MFALVISANLVNAAANWILIHGKLGMPALGVAGAAWATFAARVYMCGRPRRDRVVDDRRCREPQRGTRGDAGPGPGGHAR